MLGGHNFTFAISIVAGGFYRGFSRPVALGSVMIVVALIAWIILLPENSMVVLNQAKTYILTGLKGWFLYCLGALSAMALLVAATPVARRLRLGDDDDRPDFSTASWLSMMFCCGIGGGIVIYAVAEPMSHFITNPEMIAGTIEPNTEYAARTAVKYAFLHWGLSAWACYAILGLALALFSFRYDLPLTIRTVVAPLMRRRLAGPIGHAIDILAIVAIVAGVATTLGYGVQTLSAGLNFLAGGSLVEDAPNNLPALLTALALCTVLATGMVVSGVSRGMKWLSNLGTGLFFMIMIFFALHADISRLSAIAFGAAGDYVVQFPVLSMQVFNDTETETGAALSAWQTEWTIFYWTWWLAFSPFVGLFIARISRGRTVRQFILGCTLTPCGVCFAWFACTGSAALGHELSGINETLRTLPPSEQLYAAIAGLNTGVAGQVLAWSALLLMFILASTTLASGVLAINSIAAAGHEGAKPPQHIIMWSLTIALIIGALLAAGGTASIRDVMIIGALPISLVIALAAISVAFVLFAEARQVQPARNSSDRAVAQEDPN